MLTTESPGRSPNAASWTAISQVPWFVVVYLPNEATELPKSPSDCFNVVDAPVVGMYWVIPDRLAT